MQESRRKTSVYAGRGGFAGLTMYFKRDASKRITECASRLRSVNPRFGAAALGHLRSHRWLKVAFSIAGFEVQLP